jgi:hypothetical protein
MATPAVELRAKFLQDAAHLLAASSPSAAAFLGAARDRLVDDAALDLAPKERDALRRECCGACGNLMVPGWSCRVSHRVQAANGGASKDVAKHAARPDKLLVYTCLRCRRETVQTLQLKSPRHVAKKRKVVSSHQPALPVKKAVEEDDDSKVAKSANASSKQRKKARKGGLQAMLEKSKAQSASQGGLDLMDFAM